MINRVLSWVREAFFDHTRDDLRSDVPRDNLRFDILSKIKFARVLNWLYTFRFDPFLRWFRDKFMLNLIIWSTPLVILMVLATVLDNEFKIKKAFETSQDLGGITITEAARGVVAWMSANEPVQIKKDPIKASDQNIREIVYAEIKKQWLAQQRTIDLNHIDVSEVTSMSELFERIDLPIDISKWDVSNVEDMKGMFAYSKFNGDISGWDVSNVENMSEMFRGSKFNGDISKWNVSNVKNTTGMFEKSKFNGDISKWDVSNVKSMNGMFRDSNFNGDILGWDMSKVKRMSGIFKNSPFFEIYGENGVNLKDARAKRLYEKGIAMPNTIRALVKQEIERLGNNADLNHIDVSNVQDMSQLFFGSPFNGDISKWNVSNVKDMSGMFSDSNFNGDISQWDVSKVEKMDWMFAKTKFNGDVSKWNVSNVKNMGFMFALSKFNGDISKWNVSNVEVMSSMFAGAEFKGDVSQWNVSKVWGMGDMFSKSPLEEKYGKNGGKLKKKTSNTSFFNK